MYIQVLKNNKEVNFHGLLTAGFATDLGREWQAVPADGRSGVERRRACGCGFVRGRRRSAHGGRRSASAGSCGLMRPSPVRVAAGFR